MLKRSIYIPDELYKHIQDMAKQKGLTAASLIKLACAEYLEKEQKNRSNPRP